MKVLILGHRGLLGNAVYRYLMLQGKYELEVIEDCRWGTVCYIDALVCSSADYIINCVGAIPQKEYTKAIYEWININLPEYLDTLNKRIIHPSTDCEFSGKLKYPEMYAKTSQKDPVDDYGKSKALISEMIETKFINTKAIRSSIIGHERGGSFSLLEWFLCNDNKQINGYVNHYWNGITTLKWAQIVSDMMLCWDSYNKITQLGTEGVSKYELLSIIKRIYHKKVEIIKFKTEHDVNRLLESDIELQPIEAQLMNLKAFYE